MEEVCSSRALPGRLCVYECQNVSAQVGLAVLAAGACRHERDCQSLRQAVVVVEKPALIGNSWSVRFGTQGP